MYVIVCQCHYSLPVGSLSVSLLHEDWSISHSALHFRCNLQYTSFISSSIADHFLWFNTDVFKRLVMVSMALESTQPQTEMGTRNIPLGAKAVGA